MQPITNYHTHTFLCHHAEGKPLDYVEQATREGCAALGFSDHCPYPESFQDTWPSIRMSFEQTASYLRMVQDAKQQAPFPVYTGFECEWDSRYARWYGEELLGTFSADYLVLGSHWVTLEGGARHLYCPNIESNADLNRYIDQTIDGMRSGFFAFLAHPDLFMCGHPEWDSQAKSCSLAIIEAAKDLDLPLEVNGLGISREARNTARGMRYQYPYIEFWELVAEHGVRTICNSDAHRPQDVLMNAWKARDFAGRFNLVPMASLDMQL